MKIKVEGFRGVGDQTIDYNYDGDTTVIKEDELRKALDEIKILTLRKFTRNEDVSNLFWKAKIKTMGNINLIPDKPEFNTKSESEKDEIMKSALEIISNPNTTLKLAYKDMPSSEYVQGSIPDVGTGAVKGRLVSGGKGIHNKSRKKSKKRTKRKSNRRNKRKFNRRTKKFNKRKINRKTKKL